MAQPGPDGSAAPGLPATEPVNAADDTPQPTRTHRRAGDDSVDTAPGQDGEGDQAVGVSLEREGDVAADYLEELLDIADLDGDIDIDADADRPLVSLVGGDVSHLVGTDGSVITALQDLTRLAVTRATGARTRLVVDVDGYRDRRRGEITELAQAAAHQVRDGAPTAALPAMGAFERKIAHDAVAALGLDSESEGADPHRHVVVRAS